MLNRLGNSDIWKWPEYYLNIWECLEQLDQQIQITQRICGINKPCDGE